MPSYQYSPAILPNGLSKNIMIYPSTQNALYMYKGRGISGSLINGYFVPRLASDAITLRDWVPSTFPHIKKKGISMPAIKSKTSSVTSSYSNPNEIRVKAPKPKPETFYERVQELNATPVYIEFPDGSTLKFRYTSPVDKNRGVVESSIDGKPVDIRGYLTESGFKPDADRMKEYRLLYKKKSENRISA